MGRLDVQQACRRAPCFHASHSAIAFLYHSHLRVPDTRLPVEHEEKAVQLAATVEGHVDNLAPCIYGGMQVRPTPTAKLAICMTLTRVVLTHVLAPFAPPRIQIGVHTGSRWYTTAVNVPQGLQCILFIPEVRQETEACRAILVRACASFRGETTDG